jgi:hypothetical protein
MLVNIFGIFGETVGITYVPADQCTNTPLPELIFSKYTGWWFGTCFKLT